MKKPTSRGHGDSAGGSDEPSTEGAPDEGKSEPQRTAPTDDPSDAGKPPIGKKDDV